MVAGNSMGYVPPFTVSSRSVTLVAEIVESLSSISKSWRVNSQLCRINRLRTIHSSLAIEGNSLSIDEVTDVIDGKRVLGNPREIQEVKNAFAAYEMMDELDPFDADSLLKAHHTMMGGILDDAGQYRKVGVGVYSGTKLIHMAPPYDRVPGLVSELMEWARSSDDHPLIKSCVFHYEFEFIHPFSDGNGRTGRLWHTLILSKWNDIMSSIPIETMVRKHQQEYYDAIANSTSDGDSGVFLELMLSLILEAINTMAFANHINDIENINKTERRILFLILDGEFTTALEISLLLGVTKRTIERSISSLKAKGYIYREGSDKKGSWKLSV